MAPSLSQRTYVSTSETVSLLRNFGPFAPLPSARDALVECESEVPFQCPLE
jgi:hypothetical protein